MDGAMDSNIERVPVATRAVGGGGGLEATVEVNPHRARIWLDVEGGGQAFSHSTRWDRLTHSEELGFAFLVNENAELRATGRFDARGSTEDNEIVNQETVLGELWLRGDGPTFRALGGWRWRRYSDRDAYDENILLGGADLRQKVSREVSVRLGYRYEDADSRSQDRDYLRHRLTGAYELRLTSRLRAQLQLEHQWRRYPRDRVEVAGVETARKDRRWIPGARLIQRFPRGQEVALEYEFQSRISNDPDKEYQVHRVSLRLGWPILR
jgi:hypothetical protein